ncbi:hypothetical protein Droror1_Dr00006285 [Drosera rotundifolia]
MRHRAIPSLSAGLRPKLSARLGRKACSRRGYRRATVGSIFGWCPARVAFPGWEMLPVSSGDRNRARMKVGAKRTVADEVIWASSDPAAAGTGSLTLFPLDSSCSEPYFSFNLKGESRKLVSRRVTVFDVHHKLPLLSRRTQTPAPLIHQDYCLGYFLYLRKKWYQRTTWMYLCVPVLLYACERLIRAFRSGYYKVQILKCRHEAFISSISGKDNRQLVSLSEAALQDPRKQVSRFKEPSKPSLNHPFWIALILVSTQNTPLIITSKSPQSSELPCKESERIERRVEWCSILWIQLKFFVQVAAHALLNLEKSRSWGSCLLRRAAIRVKVVEWILSLAVGFGVSVAVRIEGALGSLSLSCCTGENSCCFRLKMSACDVQNLIVNLA